MSLSEKGIEGMLKEYKNDIGLFTQGFINTITGDIIVVTPECRFFFHTFKNRREFKFELIK